MSQCGVAHVGGDLYRAVLAVIGGVFRRRALFVCGQRAYEAAERLRVHLSAKAGEQTVGREGLRGERGKARGVFAGICLKVRSKIGEPAHTALALKQLLHRALRGKRRERLGDGVGMAVDDERLLYEIIRLQNSLAYSARFVVATVYEQLFQQPQRRGDVFLQHAGGDQQVRPAFAQLAALRDKLHARRKPAQGRLDLRLEPVGGVVLGAQLAEECGQHIEQSQLVRVEVRHVEVQIQIDYTVGVGIQPQHFHTVNARQLRFRRNYILGHVLKVQVRQRGEVFLAVHALLPLLHLLEFRSGPRESGVVPVRGSRGQALRLLARIFLPLFRRRQDVHIALVLRAAEHFDEQVGKIIGVQLLTQGVKYPCVVYMRERIITIEPAVQRADGEVQAGRLCYLAVGERGALKRRGQGFSVQTFSQQPSHSFGDERLYRGEILRRSVAHDDGDVRLIHSIVHVDAHVLREAALQKRALERRFVGAGQVIGEYLRRVQLFDILMGAEYLCRRHMRQRLFALAHLVADGLFRSHGRLHGKIKVRRAVLVL